MLREAVAGNRAHDHALAKQPVVDRRAVADAHENEVGLARHPGEPEACKRAFEKLHAFAVRPPAALHVLVVVEGGQRADLCQAVDVERLTDALERRDDLGRTNAVADPQPRETVDLRERAQRDEQPIGREVLERAGILGVDHVFRVGVVGDDHHFARHAREEPLEGLAGIDRPGRVVRVAEEHQAGRLPYRRCDRVQVVREIAQRHGAGNPRRRLHDRRVDDERLLRHHCVLAGA